MSIRIGSNTSSASAQRLLALNESAQRTTLLRLSSGLRINSAGDDAAGLSVSSSLTAKSRVYTQAIRNANDGISALAIADATLGQLSEVVIRLKELATGAANGSLGRLQRVSNDKEASALVDEFNRIVASASFNGRKLLDGQLGELALQLGFGTVERLSVGLGNELRRKQLRNYSGPPNSDPGLEVVVGDSATADLNGDGKLDLAVADASGVNLYWGNGDGTFQSGGTVGAAGGILYSGLKLGDVNGDGRLDIIQANNNGLGGGGLHVSIGNGDGTFQAASALNAGNFLHLEIGDLDGDGDVDIITSAVGGAIQTRLGVGNGSFQAAASTGLTTNSTYYSFALGDLDGDGKLDIAYAGASGLHRALGSGNGLFTSNAQVSAGAGHSSIALSDFNSDGILDIAATRSGSAYTHTGTGAGTFGSAALVGAALGRLLVADLNGDGENDLISTAAGSTTVAFFGNGQGGFTSEQYQALLTNNVADFNSDGVLDLISITGGVSIANTNYTTNIGHLDLTTREGALTALGSLDSILQRITSERGGIGSLQSRLNAGLGALMARVDNYQAANSRIIDADIAQESAELVKRNILAQVGASVLAQANQAPALALTLLR